MSEASALRHWKLPDENYVYYDDRLKENAIAAVVYGRHNIVYVNYKTSHLIDVKLLLSRVYGTATDEFTDLQKSVNEGEICTKKLMTKIENSDFLKPNFSKSKFLELFSSSTCYELHSIYFSKLATFHRLVGYNLIS